MGMGSEALFALEVILALEIAMQVAAGLAAVHKEKLVHRDIKPSNIMVSLEDGGAVTAKIIDLGLARRPLNQVLKPRFQRLDALPEHPVLPARSSSPASMWTSARTCTR
jgi:serine/threonine protein kinase